MNITHYFFTSLLFLISISNIHAQSTAEEITEKFFIEFETSPEKAIDYAFSTNPWIIERNKDGIETVKNKLSNSLALVGEYHGFEKIVERKVGENLVLISFMVKYDRQPIRFNFVLYRPKDQWRVQNFKFDDNIDSELESSASVDRLKQNWE